MGKKIDLTVVANGLAATKAALDKQIADVETYKKAYDEKALGFLANGAPQVLTQPNHMYSYEKGLLHKFNCKSLAQLINVDTSLSRAADINDKLAVMDIKKHFDISRWIAQMIYGAPLDRGDMMSEDGTKLMPGIAVRNILDTPYAKEFLVPMLKAFGSTVGGAGDEWVPTALSTNFIPEFELERKVANEVQQMQMTTNPFEVPVQTDTTTARIIAEGVAMTGANFGTAKLTWNAKKYGEFYPIPEELNEDSAPNFLAVGRSEIIEAQIRARETGILNGDDSGTHQDSDTDAGGADLAEKGFKGWRQLSLANSANGGDVDFLGAAITTPKLDACASNMGKFGVNPRDVMYVMGATGYNQSITLDEVSTVDNFGSNATILTGLLAAFRGKGILISDFIREDLNAAGVHDGITETRTVVHCVHKKRFWLGIRRPIRSRVQMDLANQDRWLLASYQRMDFQGLPQDATETSVVTGRNILV
jgi:hypothetical protein